LLLVSRRRTVAGHGVRLLLAVTVVGILACERPPSRSTVGADRAAVTPGADTAAATAGADRAAVLQLALPAPDSAGRRGLLNPEPGDCGPTDPSLDLAEQEALDDCRRQARIHGAWSAEEAHAMGYELVRLDTLPRVPDVKPWEPGGGDHPTRETRIAVPLTTLSRPGMSRDGRLAVVAYLFYCGPLCGVSSVERFHRTQGAWRRDSVIRRMVS
jgi:hypothetical protein